MGDKIFLKISSVNGIRKFNVKGKLSPKYIGSHEVIGKFNALAYRLDLSVELEHMHNVFHIPQP